MSVGGGGPVSPHPGDSGHPHHHHSLQGGALHLAGAPAQAVRDAGLRRLQCVRGECETGNLLFLFSIVVLVCCFLLSYCLSLSFVGV